MLVSLKSVIHTVIHTQHNVIIDDLLLFYSNQAYLSIQSTTLPNFTLCSIVFRCCSNVKLVIRDLQLSLQTLQFVLANIMHTSTNCLCDYLFHRNIKIHNSLFVKLCFTNNSPENYNLKVHKGNQVHFLTYSS